MEKRKLAKIPREEASDEMVRFAERAAGTHIVTTKDIEKDLLMVTFYPIRKLKKGKKDAQLRTFFSKNDYISQDLTVEKVKWLTAAYDRMYSVLNEILTNTEMEVAEEKGCLVLSTASDGAVWIDNGVNTLVHPDANHDSGWKKIRRTKTRYELLNRANAAADALVGKVDNDTNGRATIMAAIQGICNAMEAEGKIQYGNVTESTTVTTDGDTCGFDIEVIDLDSAEHIYLNYYFQFSTIVAASGE